MTEFRRHINKTDLVAVLFLGFIFGISLTSQLTGLARTGIFTLLTGAVLAVLGWLIFMPAVYSFTEKELRVRGPWPLPERKIPYENVLDIDAVGSYVSFRMDADAAEIVLTWKVPGQEKSRRTSCHPTHAKEFVQLLDERCTHLLPKETKASGKNDLISVLRGKQKE